MRRSPWVPRLVLGAGGIALLGAIIAIAVGEGGSEEIELTGAGQTQQLIGGILQEGALLGSDDAPVVMTVFNDLQAPSGQDFELDVVDPLIEEFVRTGDMRVEIRHFSFTERETNLAAYAATSAGEQDRQWQYLDLFFRNQDEAHGVVTQEFLRDIANAVPELDTDQWSDDIDSEAVHDTVETDAALGDQLRLPAAPAVEVTGPGGNQSLDDSPSLDEVRAAIESVS